MKNENKSNLLILFAGFAAVVGAVIAVFRWLDKLKNRPIHRSFQRTDGELRRSGREAQKENGMHAKRRCIPFYFAQTAGSVSACLRRPGSRLSCSSDRNCRMPGILGSRYRSSMPSI